MLLEVEHAEVVPVAVERLSDLEVMEDSVSRSFDDESVIRLVSEYKFEQDVPSALVEGIGEE